MNKLSLTMCVAAASAAMVVSAAGAPKAVVATQVAPGQTAITSGPGVTRITFGSEGITSLVHETKLPEAMVNHDAAATFAAAQKMAKYEAKAKAAEKVFNSQNVYKHAAIFAAGQGNVQLMQQIVTAAPATKVYMQQMTVTRGANKKAPAAIPQMVEVSFGGWAKLTPAQAPIWGDYIMAFYPQMNRAAAEIIANKVNSSRSMMAPALLAEVAVDLGKFAGKAVPAAFQAKNVFNNAVDMAIFLNDKAAMEKIVALYNKASFKDAKTAKTIASELKAMGKKRGFTEIKSRGTTRMAFGPGGLCGYENIGTNSVRTYTGKSAQARVMMMAYEDNW